MVIGFKKKNKTKKEILIQSELKNLIHEFRVIIIAPIRQEILSGISSSNKFETLKEHLFHFVDSPISTEHYIQAAEFFNICRKKGIQGSHLDFLICSFAYSNNLPTICTEIDAI